MTQQSPLLPASEDKDADPNFALTCGGVPAGIPLAGSAAVPAGAADLTEGDISGFLATTVSVGAAIRTADRDPNLVGAVNGGGAVAEVNFDDGNLNYGRGDVVSADTEVTHELSLNRGNLGVFARANYFFDHAVVDRETDHKPLIDSVLRSAGRDFRLLDASVAGDFDVGRTPLLVRAGRQVINGGESVFIRNGLNSSHPLDAATLRVAGAELRDGFLPVPAVSVNLGVSGDLPVEGVCQLGGSHTEIEPLGTFFSTNDYGSPGRRSVYGNCLVAADPAPAGDDCNSKSGVFRGFTVGRIAQVLAQARPIPDLAAAPAPVQQAFQQAAQSAWLTSPVGAAVPRERDPDADDGGQFGMAVRYFSEGLNNTEPGFHFARIHSRLPVASVRTGTAPSVNIGLGPDRNLCRDGQPCLQRRILHRVSGRHRHLRCQLPHRDQRDGICPAG